MTSYLVTVETDDSKSARGMNEQLLRTSSADVLSSRKQTEKNLRRVAPPPPPPRPLVRPRVESSCSKNSLEKVSILKYTVLISSCGTAAHPKNLGNTSDSIVLLEIRVFLMYTNRIRFTLLIDNSQLIYCNSTQLKNVTTHSPICVGNGNNYKTNIAHFSFSLIRIQIIVLNQCLSFTGSARVELSPGRLVRQQQRHLA